MSLENALPPFQHTAQLSCLIVYRNAIVYECHTCKQHSHGDTTNHNISLGDGSMCSMPFRRTSTLLSFIAVISVSLPCVAIGTLSRDLDPGTAHRKSLSSLIRKLNTTTFLLSSQPAPSKQYCYTIFLRSFFSYLNVTLFSRATPEDQTFLSREQQRPK